MNKRRIGQKMTRAILKSWKHLSGKPTPPSNYKEAEVVKLIISKAEKKYLEYLQAQTTNAYKSSCLKGVLNCLTRLKSKVGNIFKNHPYLNNDFDNLCNEIDKAIINLQVELLAA